MEENITKEAICFQEKKILFHKFDVSTPEQWKWKRKDRLADCIYLDLNKGFDKPYAEDCYEN